MYYYGDRDEVDLGPEATREFSEWGWRVSWLPCFFFFFWRERERDREREEIRNLSNSHPSIQKKMKKKTPKKQDLAEVAANVVPFKRRAYEAVAREFGPVIAARARRGRGGRLAGEEGARGGKKGEEGEEEEDGDGGDGGDESLLCGWWGLSLGGHQEAAAAQAAARRQQHRASSRRSLQNQILPASGVAMKAREKQQRQ